ncbi:MAG: hypothetical protein ACP5D7_06590 [Limnospira sp.]
MRDRSGADSRLRKRLFLWLVFILTRQKAEDRILRFFQGLWVGQSILTLPTVDLLSCTPDVGLVMGDRRIEIEI